MAMPIPSGVTPHSPRPSDNELTALAVAVASAQFPEEKVNLLSTQILSTGYLGSEHEPSLDFHAIYQSAILEVIESYEEEAIVVPGDEVPYDQLIWVEDAITMGKEYLGALVEHGCLDELLKLNPDFYSAVKVDQALQLRIHGFFFECLLKNADDQNYPSVDRLCDRVILAPVAWANDFREMAVGLKNTLRTSQLIP